MAVPKNPSELKAVGGRPEGGATRADRTLRAPTRLWERRTDDQDFGVIRLGMGIQPSSLIYELEQADESLLSQPIRSAGRLGFAPRRRLLQEARQLW